MRSALIGVVSIHAMRCDSSSAVTRLLATRSLSSVLMFVVSPHAL